MKRISLIVLIAGIIFITLGITITTIVNEEPTLSLTCQVAFTENKQQSFTEEINEWKITFNFLDCLDKNTEIENIEYKSNADNFRISLSTNNIDITTQADILFTNYNMDDSYPSYYLFIEDKKTTEEVEYKLVYASKVDDSEDVLSIIYNIVYPLDEGNSLNLEIEGNPDILRLELIEEVANSLTVTKK